MTGEIRLFFVAADGTATEATVSDGLSQAYDVLHAAGLADHKRLTLVHAAERGGRDPVAFAHHLVSLCSAAQEG